MGCLGFGLDRSVLMELSFMWIGVDGNPHPDKDKAQYMHLTCTCKNSDYRQFFDMYFSFIFMNPRCKNRRMIRISVIESVTCTPKSYCIDYPVYTYFTATTNPVIHLGKA